MIAPEQCVMKDLTTKNKKVYTKGEKAKRKIFIGSFVLYFICDPLWFNLVKGHKL